MLLRRHRAERVNRQTSSDTAAAPDVADELDGLTVAALRDLAGDRGLSKSGSKAELRARLLEAASAGTTTDSGIVQGPTDPDDIDPDAADAPGDPEGDTDDDEGDDIADAEAETK